MEAAVVVTGGNLGGVANKGFQDEEEEETEEAGTVVETTNPAVRELSEVDFGNSSERELESEMASVDIGEKLSREQDTTDILWSVSVQYWTHLCCTLSLYTCIPSTQANQRRTFNLHSPPINQSIDLMIIYYRHKYYCYCHHIIISRLESFSLLTDRKSSNKD